MTFAERVVAAWYTPRLTAMAALLSPLSLVFLRGSLEARFGDMGPPMAVLGAWLAVAAVDGAHRSLLSRAATGALLAVSLLYAGLATWPLWRDPASRLPANAE